MDHMYEESLSSNRIHVQKVINRCYSEDISAELSRITHKLGLILKNEYVRLGRN